MFSYVHSYETVTIIKLMNTFILSCSYRLFFFPCYLPKSYWNTNIQALKTSVYFVLSTPKIHTREEEDNYGES